MGLEPFRIRRPKDVDGDALLQEAHGKTGGGGGLRAENVFLFCMYHL